MEFMSIQELIQYIANQRKQTYKIKLSYFIMGLAIGILVGYIFIAYFE